jgi:hypothetical protein
MYGGGVEAVGLGALAEFATQVGQAEAADIRMASPEESGEGRPGGGRGADNGKDDNGQGLDKGPGAVKLAAMAAVAKTIKPGCVHWNVKDKASPKENKPNAEVLRAEVLRRDSTKRPSGWDIKKLCEFLYKNAPSPGEAGGRVTVLIEASRPYR